MKSILAVLLLAACSYASAEDLFISVGGQLTYYSGTISHVETAGLMGEVILLASGPGEVSDYDEAPPTEAGLWHVVVVQPNGTRLDTVMTCSATTAFAVDCGWLVTLNCASGLTTRIRPSLR
jgi:hypothetical protein